MGAEGRFAGLLPVPDDVGVGWFSASLNLLAAVAKRRVTPLAAIHRRCHEAPETPENKTLMRIAHAIEAGARTPMIQTPGARSGSAGLLDALIERNKRSAAQKRPAHEPGQGRRRDGARPFSQCTADGQERRSGVLDWKSRCRDYPSAADASCVSCPDSKGHSRRGSEIHQSSGFLAIPALSHLGERHAPPVHPNCPTRCFSNAVSELKYSPHPEHWQRLSVSLRVGLMSKNPF